MMMAPEFVNRLEQEAIAAQRSEIAFRRDIAAEIERRERDRQYAFRRLDLARTMAKAAGETDSEEKAIAAQVAALRAELGWYGDTEERQRVFEAWREVATAVAASVASNARDDASTEDGAALARTGTGKATENAESDTDADTQDAARVPDAMRAFEDWYEREFGKPFLALFDQEIPEFPVVEF